MVGLTFAVIPVSGVSGITGTLEAPHSVGTVCKDITGSQFALILIGNITALATKPIATLALGLKASTILALVPRHSLTVICIRIINIKSKSNTIKMYPILLSYSLSTSNLCPMYSYL